MKLSITKRFAGRYFGASLDLRIQAFNLLAFAGMAAGVITALSALFSHAGLFNIVLNLCGSAVSIFCLWFVGRTKNYRAGFVIAVTLTFLIIFPLLFFSAGAYRSGMPCFFVFAFMFTAIMLEGKPRIAFLVTEFALYACCFLAAYYFPDIVIWFPTEAYAMSDTLAGLIIVGAVLVVVVLLYIRIYDSRQKQLESLDKLKTEFFQNVNHDMKTPLTIIAGDIGNAEDMLGHGAGKAAIREYLIRAQGEIENLAHIVEYSLSLAAAQEGKQRMEALDFAALLSVSAGAFDALLKKDGNSLGLQIPDGLPLLTGNRDMLKQVVNNLIFNAGKHTKNGEINVSLTREGQQLITAVADTGEGIDPAALPRIFERGVSGDQATGYGLSICKVIVEMHGGGIWIESEPGKGTAVRFSLPLRREGAL